MIWDRGGNSTEVKHEIYYTIGWRKYIGSGHPSICFNNTWSCCVREVNLYNFF